MSNRIIFLKRPNPHQPTHIEVWVIHENEPAKRLPLTIYPTQSKTWTVWGTHKWQAMTPQPCTEAITTHHSEYVEYLYEAKLSACLAEVRKTVKAYLGNRRV